MRLRTSQWPYPVALGAIVGVIVSGVAFRLSTHVPTQLATGSGSVGSAYAGPGPVSQRPSVSGGLTAVGGPATPTKISGAANPLSGGTGTSGGSSPSSVSPSAGPGPSSGGGGAPGGPPVGGALTSSDVGVSPTTIRIGVALTDLGPASQFGAAVPGYDPKQEQQEWQTLINYVNAHGGILGRKLQPFFEAVNVLDSSTVQAACVQFTQTDHVFLVFSGAAMSNGDGDLCVAGANHTLDVNRSIVPTQLFQQAAGLMISINQAGSRYFADWALTMQRLGKLQGHKLGLLVDQGDAQEMADSGLITTLRSLGYHITYTAAVSQDPSQGPEEAATQVEQMRAAGVDTVFMASAFYTVTAFVNDADKQAWNPQYLLTDYDGADVGTLDDGMPHSFVGAIAMTDYGFPLGAGHSESPADAACRTEWDSAGGATLTTSDPSYSVIVADCLDLKLLQTAAQRVGPDLTRSAFSQAVQALGSSFDWGTMGGSFSPGKTDYDDVVRAMVWSPGGSGNCNSNGTTCWNNDGPSFNPQSG